MGQAIASNRTALVLLLAALVLAVLTNRWVTRGFGGVAFSVVSFDGVYYALQWVAFAMTVAALLLLGADWRATGRFPPPVALGLALLAFFVATGIPQAPSQAAWQSGDVGVTRWLRLLAERRAADAIAPHFLGTWKSPARTYAIERHALTVTSAERVERFGAARCPTGLLMRFAYASDATFHFNPAAEAYARLLDGPPMPSLEVACDGNLHTFVKLADGRVLAFHGLQNPNPSVETLSR